MNKNSLAYHAPDFAQGFVSEEGFRVLLDVEGEGSASAAGALASALMPLRQIVFNGGIVRAHHPASGRIHITSMEQFDSWCAEFFPCAVHVWSALVWNAERQTWERKGDHDLAH